MYVFMCVCRVFYVWSLGQFDKFKQRKKGVTIIEEILLVILGSVEKNSLDFQRFCASRGMHSISS